MVRSEIPCGLGWVVWAIHWWFAKSKSVSVMQAGAVYQPPPAPLARPPQPP
jgi:hypothetical protein